MEYLNKNNIGVQIINMESNPNQSEKSDKYVISAVLRKRKALKSSGFKAFGAPLSRLQNAESQ